MLSRKSRSPHSRISCQYIIHIIKSLIICYNVFSFYTKAKLVAYLYILRIKIRLRSCKSAFWTIIISQLAVMIETIFQLLTASLAETSLPDFICCLFDHRFTIICIFGTLRIISSRMFIVISISPYLSSWSRKRFVRSI